MSRKIDSQPKLIDSDIVRKLSETYQAPPKEDYWGPVKEALHRFFLNYIKPNVVIIIIIIIFVLFLIYRYRHKSEFSQKENETKENVGDAISRLYQEQKELSREPRLKYNYQNSNGILDPVN